MCEMLRTVLGTASVLPKREGPLPGPRVPREQLGRGSGVNIPQMPQPSTLDRRFVSQTGWARSSAVCDFVQDTTSSPAPWIGDSSTSDAAPKPSGRQVTDPQPPAPPPRCRDQLRKSFIVLPA